ncbi:TonB family protein [Roseateles sp. BYS78W]|uniref:TonB family protein n=1 Tax=Pelomonas candidula TaxID=3299025 RepID=A0ABW7HEF8_9BURK
MTSGPRVVLTFNLTAIATALLLLSQPVAAQTEPAAADKSLERAQKAADAVFHWIKINGDKGATRQAPAPAPSPAPAPVARKAAPAPAPIAAAPRPAPAPVAAPATAPAIAAAPAVAEPIVAAAAPTPEPQPERPVLLAAAEPTPAPAAPMATAARAVEPPPPPPEEEAEVPLKLLSRVNPGIPRQLQQTTFRNGFARVKFTVAPDGTVSKVEVIGASHSRLGTSAVDAVKQWRFAPIPTPREVAIEFAFNNVDE